MRRALVTGGSRGIGFEVAHALAERGYGLDLVARDPDALARAIEALPGSGHSAHAFDVSDEHAWAALELHELQGLVCAAAVLEPIGTLGEYDLSAFRRTLDINVCGTLFAVHRCLEPLRAGAGAVVTFSGGGGTGPMPRFDAYAASKAAVVRLSENLSIELAPLPVNCVAPGFVATGMHEATLAAGPGAAGHEYYERTRRELREGGVPAAEAAELVCTLLEDPRCTGKLISAQWDPWREPEFRERLAADGGLGTLRRIDGMLFAEAAS
jgi:NAD(P)-dependent dehydrogenase (short-subunit alcohol dehydrogenase family)